MKSILQLKVVKNGFTLIEILIAISIGAVVLTLLYNALFQIINAKEKVENINEISQEIRVIFSVLSRDLANVFPKGQFSDKTSPKEPYFRASIENNNSKLVFTSLVRDTVFNESQSDQTEISYYLVPVNRDNIGSEQLFALVRRDNPFFDKEEDRGTIFPVSERVVSFTLNFIDANSLGNLNGEKKREWNSLSLNSLPKAVEVNLDLQNSKGENERYSRIIIIPIAK